MSGGKHYRPIRRRDAVCGGGLAVFGAMLTALLGGPKPVQAASLSG